MIARGIMATVAILVIAAFMAAAFALGFSTCLRYWERHPQKDDDTDRCNADE